MPSINDRIGSQNVIRVLSNASAPPTKLVNMNDVDTSREGENGLVLVWDSDSKKFILTDKVQAATFIQAGITSISNETQSSTATTGALTVAGGVGITKNLTLGTGLVAAGIATFSGNIDANASVDIFRDLRINNNLSVTGLTTFTGITTTVGDLYVGGDLYLQDDLVLDNITGASLSISGVATANSVSIGVTEVLSSTFGLKNILSVDATTTATIEAAIASGPNTFDSLNVTGISTFRDNVYFPGAAYNIQWDQATSKFKFDDAAQCVFGSASGGDLKIYHTGGNSTIKNETGQFRLAGNDLRLQSQDSSEDYLLAVDGGSVSIFFNDVKRLETSSTGVNVTDTLSVAGVATVTGTLTAGLIDGGSY
tara:strand:- start:395 stop:1495 length:1101 start_codon:yes stop_codon:yes gene_type:complete